LRKLAGLPGALMLGRILPEPVAAQELRGRMTKLEFIKQ
jgi:hypothetical protein